MREIKILGGLMLVLGMVGPVGAAPVVVLSSTLPTLQPGAVVDGATSVSVPAGGMVIINDATGKTRTLTGPYNGPIGQDKAEQGGETGLMKSLIRLVTSREQDQTRLASVRGKTALNNSSHSSTHCKQPGKEGRWSLRDAVYLVDQLGQQHQMGSFVPKDGTFKLCVTLPDDGMVSILYKEGAEPLEIIVEETSVKANDEIIFPTVDLEFLKFETNEPLISFIIRFERGKIEEQVVVSFGLKAIH